MKSSNRTKASFAVIGVMRSGTTSLAHSLSRHPLIRLCKTEHSGFFAKDVNFEKGVPSPTLFQSNGHEKSADMIWGDVCPNYIFHTPSIARLSHYNPGIKLITILRNPAERAFSHWQYATYKGKEKRPFMKAINDELNARHVLRDEQDQLNVMTSSYLARSMYGEQIQSLYQYFDPHQLLFIRAEDFKYDTQVTMYQVFQFLHLPYEDVDCTAQNVGFYHLSISAADYNAVNKIFEKDIYLTEELLGWNCNEWLRPLNTRRPLETFFQQVSP